MAHYKLYFLDHADHIRKAIDLECDTDEQAIAAVEDHRKTGPLELWQGARCVQRFPAAKR